MDSRVIAELDIHLVSIASDEGLVQGPTTAQWTVLGHSGAGQPVFSNAATSPGTGLAYGVERVCTAPVLPRYALQSRQAGTVEHAATNVGDRTTRSDVELLAGIRADLAASSWPGERRRTVWARRRRRDGSRVSRKCGRRIMRENSLLSPHRRRRWPPAPCRRDRHRCYQPHVGHRRRAG